MLNESVSGFVNTSGREIGMGKLGEIEEVIVGGIVGFLYKQVGS